MGALKEGPKVSVREGSQERVGDALDRSPVKFRTLEEDHKERCQWKKGVKKGSEPRRC